MEERDIWNESKQVETLTVLEPFCSACDGGLELQDGIWTAHDAITDKFLGFVLLCPWCGKTLWPSNIG